VQRMTPGLSVCFDLFCGPASTRSIGEGTVPAPVPFSGMKLALVGGGRMGEALLTGLLRSGWAEATEVAVVEALEPRRRALQELFPRVEVRAEPREADGVVIAVKPGDVGNACRATAEAGCRRALSIAAGVSLATLEDALGPGVAVVRAMPNTPAL